MASASNGHDPELLELLQGGETHLVEFKSSIRYGYEEDRYNKYLKWAITKTVAGFLNADGGNLFIGVDDDGNVLGLENDLDTFRGDVDLPGYEGHLRGLLERRLTPSSQNLVGVAFPRLESRAVCHVRVEPSPRPVLADHRGETRFYARNGARTLKLLEEELAAYLKHRYGEAVALPGKVDL